MYRKINEEFEFNVVFLGNPKVGKTSLIQSIVSGTANLVGSSETDHMYEMLNMRQSVRQEISKHRLQLPKSNQIVPMSLYDTKGAHYSS